MGITIRKASAQDAPFLAQMILQSSRSGKKECLFDFLFGTGDDKKVLKKLEALTQTNSKSYCHFENFLVAELDGQKVGSLCAYEPRISTKQAFKDALLEIGCEEENLAVLEEMQDCEFDLNNRTLMFSYMEEADSFRDVGVLKALMQKSLLTARLKGYRIAQTIVEIGALETIYSYKKLDFKEVKTKECEFYREKFGRPGLMLLAVEF